MSTTSQIVNLLEEQNNQMPTTQMDFIPFPTTFPPPLGCNNQSLKAFSSTITSESDSTSNLTETLLATTAAQNSRDHQYLMTSSSFGGPQFLSLHRSNVVNPWPSSSGGGVTDCFVNNKRSGVDDHHNLGISVMKMKKMKGRRKVREPRFCFKTLSDVDVLDDGYKWRKYGQKVVKNTQHPRSYYRCTQDNCHVKKRVERLAEDPRMVITTYEGRHAHSPSNDLEDSQSPYQFDTFLW